MRIAIHQPNYIPWCGYFAKLRAADVFVFLDDAEMSSQSYIYRCQIRGPKEPQWLSMPNNRHLHQQIREVKLHGTAGAVSHLGKLQGIYRKAPFYREVMALIEPIYKEPGELLSEFNQRLIVAIAGYLGITTRFEVSSRLAPAGTADDRLIDLVRKLGGSTYVSGKGGQNYQDPAKFAAAGIGLEIRVYRPVAYTQAQGEFMPGLSMIDGLFNLGREAAQLLVYAEDSGGGGAAEEKATSAAAEALNDS
jgi:WbqC-like protein family